MPCILNPDVRGDFSSASIVIQEEMLELVSVGWKRQIIKILLPCHYDQLLAVAVVWMKIIMLNLCHWVSYSKYNGEWRLLILSVISFVFSLLLLETTPSINSIEQWKGFLFLCYQERESITLLMMWDNFRKLGVMLPTRELRVPKDYEIPFL